MWLWEVALNAPTEFYKYSKQHELIGNTFFLHIHPLSLNDYSSVIKPPRSKVQPSRCRPQQTFSKTCKAISGKSLSVSMVEAPVTNPSPGLVLGSHTRSSICFRSPNPMSSKRRSKPWRIRGKSPLLKGRWTKEPKTVIQRALPPLLESISPSTQRA